MRSIGLLKEFPQEGTYVCPHCGKKYKNDATMKSHIRKEHPKGTDEEEKNANN